MLSDRLALIRHRLSIWRLSQHSIVGWYPEDVGDLLAERDRLAVRVAELEQQIASADIRAAILRADLRTAVGELESEKAAREKAEASAAVLRKTLEFVRDVVNESSGVEGYHINGDVASWDELGIPDEIETALASSDAGKAVPPARPTLFQRGEFTLHSGAVSRFKIECDALTEDDWATIAAVIAERVHFRRVIGIANGGIPLAKALQPYAEVSDFSQPVLIVDDVLTTGSSMERAREQHPRATGVVLFARSRCPDWVMPVFQMWYDAGQEQQHPDTATMLVQVTEAIHHAGQGWVSPELAVRVAELEAEVRQLRSVVEAARALPWIRSGMLIEVDGFPGLTGPSRDPRLRRLHAALEKLEGEHG